MRVQSRHVRLLVVRVMVRVRVSSDPLVGDEKGCLMSDMKFSQERRMSAFATNGALGGPESM